MCSLVPGVRVYKKVFILAFSTFFSAFISLIFSLPLFLSLSLFTSFHIPLSFFSTAPLFFLVLPFPLSASLHHSHFHYLCLPCSLSFFHSFLGLFFFLSVPSISLFLLWQYGNIIISIHNIVQSYHEHSQHHPIIPRYS